MSAVVPGFAAAAANPQIVKKLNTERIIVGNIDRGQGCGSVCAAAVGVALDSK